MKFPWFLSLSVGFLSLSQEILWMRYISFANLTVPKSFTFVLTIFLAGIAMGALRGKNVCEKTDKLYTASAAILIGGGMLDMLGPMVAAFIPKSTAVAVPLIYLCSMLKGMIFPIAHHLGSLPVKGKVGKSVSRVYFMNIIGSTLGPLLTGFWLLDHAGLQFSMLLMGWLTIVLGISCLAREKPARMVVASSLLPLLLACAFLLPDRMVPWLACRVVEGNAGPAPITRVVETKSGIIHTVMSDHGGGDYTMGGNVYDGRENISPRVNSNILERLFVLAALRPHAENILVIGLSSGAWVRILQGFPDVKNIDVVEINPGYLELIRANPDIAPILKDPRIHIHIDDGRRWLKRYPGKSFDLVVMNTTFHWRAYSTNLLSADFLKIVKAHLNKGAVITYNSTESPDVLKTAESVFPYAFKYLSFVVASDEDFRPRIKNGRERLLEIRRDNHPAFDRHNAADMAFINRTLSVPFTSTADEPPEVAAKAEIITDWNMITEFKHGVLTLAACPGH